MIPPKNEQVSRDTLVICHISDRDRKYTAKINANCSTVERDKRDYQSEQKGGGKRGEITTFSRASRKRMFFIVNSIRNVEWQLFVTPTVIDDDWIAGGKSPRWFKQRLQALFKRIERKFPAAVIVWRVEYKVRKSGDLTGEVVPHAHLLIGNVGTHELETIREWFSKAWSEITGSKARGESTIIDTRQANNHRHAINYLSKYAAKTGDDTPEDESTISEFFHNHSGEIGRHWGIRGEYDVSSSAEISLNKAQFIEFKRLIVKLHAARGNKRFSRYLARSSPEFGFGVLGFGDERAGLPDSDVLRAIKHAVELAKMKKLGKPVREVVEPR